MISFKNVEIYIYITFKVHDFICVSVCAKLLQNKKHNQCTARNCFYVSGEPGFHISQFWNHYWFFRSYNVDPNHLRAHLWQSSEHFFSDFIFAFIRLFRLCQRHRPRFRHLFRPWDALGTWESRNPRFLWNRYFTKPRSYNDLWRPARRVLISLFSSVVENEFVNDHRENKSLWDMSFCIYLIKKFKPETST